MTAFIALLIAVPVLGVPLLVILAATIDDRREIADKLTGGWR